MNTALKSDIISKCEHLAEVIPSLCFEPSPIANFSMWKDRTDFFHFKLAQAKQRLFDDAVFMAFHNSGSILELKMILAKITEIIEYQEKHGQDRTKAKAKMDETFGLVLMRSPEVKRWE